MFDKASIEQAQRDASGVQEYMRDLIRELEPAEGVPELRKDAHLLALKLDQLAGAVQIICAVLLAESAA